VGREGGRAGVCVCAPAEWGSACAGTLQRVHHGTVRQGLRLRQHSGGTSCAGPDDARGGKGGASQGTQALPTIGHTGGDGHHARAGHGGTGGGDPATIQLCSLELRGE
jgi:hypothetical protein